MIGKNGVVAESASGIQSQAAIVGKQGAQLQQLYKPFSGKGTKHGTSAYR